MEMRIQVAEHIYFNVKLKSATFTGSLLNFRFLIHLFIFIHDNIIHTVIQNITNLRSFIIETE